MMAKSFLYISLFICIAIQSICGKLTVQVEPKAQDCFGVDAKRGERIKIVFFVVRGGLLDIDMRVSSLNILCFQNNA